MTAAPAPIAPTPALPALAPIIISSSASTIIVFALTFACALILALTILFKIITSALPATATPPALPPIAAILSKSSIPAALTTNELALT